MINVVFSKKDFKFDAWSAEVSDKKYKLFANDNPSIIAPSYLIKLIIKGGVSAYVFRYLNDKPSFVYACLKLLSDILVIVICKLWGIKIFWIIHNIDRESIRNFPKLVLIRRNLVSKYTERIFATDQLLVNYAIKVFPSYVNKISYITMGKYYPSLIRRKKTQSFTTNKTYVLRNGYNFDDAGFVFYLSIIYAIFDSPLAARFINIILNMITALMLFRIGKRFMSVKYAYFAALVCGIASFTVYYQSSGLKESLMLLIIVASYYNYYLYLDKPRLKHLFFLLVFSLLLLFFRVPLVIFVLASLLFTEYLKKGRLSFRRILVSGILLSVILVVGTYFTEIVLSYQHKFNPILYKTSGSVTPSMFLQLSSVLAGVFGPFPSIVPLWDNQDTVMHAPGLIIKAFLSTFFVFSLYLAWKRKQFELVPLIFFCVFQIISLSYLVHTFKLRNQFPHLASLIIVSFYVINIISNERGHRRIKLSINTINFGLVFVLFFWNYLRF